MKGILFKICIVFLFELFCYIQVRAQSNLDKRLRTLEMSNDVIYGAAPVGSLVKLYRSAPGNCQPQGKAIDSVITVAPYVWIFRDDSFTGNYVVSMTMDGVEQFESTVLANDEFRIEQDQCGDPGTISLFPSVRGNFTYTWKDQNGTVVGNGPRLDAQPGRYSLEYSVPGGCVFRSGVLFLPDAAHPVSKTVTMPCGTSEQVIRADFTVSDPEGSYPVTWQDANGTTLPGNGPERQLSAGTYYFYVTSPSGCVSERATITVNATVPLASIDANQMSITPANCGQANGAISGVTTTAGPGGTYRWTGTLGNVYYTLDIKDVPPDVYRLEVFAPGSNCPTVLNNIEVPELNAITIDTRNYKAVQTSCGENNGSITGIVAVNATTYRWFNVANPQITVSDQLDLYNAAPGYYMLELKNDIVGCVLLSREFHIQETSPEIVVTKPPVINPDECDLLVGSIMGIEFNTAIKSYTWLNGSGAEVGNTRNLTNIGAGVYTLLVKSDKCEASYTYTVTQNPLALPAPVMDNILVCAASDVLVSFAAQGNEAAVLPNVPDSVHNHLKYRIYNAAGTLIGEQESPEFRIRVDQPGQFYAALASGTCESPGTTFNIDFGSSGLVIPSAFSPNGDGQNDQWIIKGIDVYTTPEVKIFNRQGSMVFHSRGRVVPFDGKSRGTDLPVGVYYYLVKASEECPVESGSLTIIR